MAGEPVFVQTGPTIEVRPATPHLLAYLLLLTSCAKMETPTPETARTPELDAGWVANVTGPAFSKFGSTYKVPRGAKDSTKMKGRLTGD